MWISLFHYERPQDRDRLSKLDLNKRLSDQVTVATGLNFFDGAPGYEDREIGMLRNGDIFHARPRFSFDLPTRPTAPEYPRGTYAVTANIKVVIRT